MLKGDEVASYLIQKRGYLVVKFHTWVDRPGVGDRFETFAGMPLSQPIVLTEPTTDEDWKEQSAVALPFKTDPAVPQGKSALGYFFKAITD